MKCALCRDKDCYGGKDCTSIKEEVRKEYTGENLELMKAAAALESEGYMKLTRIEELISFCKSMGFKKLGMAFCIGFEREAEAIHKLLGKDFEVHSVCCKVCGISKEDFGLKKIRENRYEATCDPIGQAEVLNREGTELNIILGLCVGHDVLFAKHSKALITTLAVKDRVLAHNPMGAIYSRYYRRKLGIE